MTLAVLVGVLLLSTPSLDGQGGAPALTQTPASAMTPAIRSEVIGAAAAGLAQAYVDPSVFFPATRLAKGVWLMAASDHRWVNGWFIADPLCIAFFVAMSIYYIGLDAKLGATLGKRVVRVRVIARSGMFPGGGRASSETVFA